MDPRDDISRILSHSLWKAKQRRVWQFFCPNCKNARRLAMPRNPVSREAIVQLTVATAFFTLMSSPWVGWKGCIVAIPLAVVYEVYYRLKLRSMMECPHCGFDPYLYTLDVKLARREIETYWRRKFSERGLPFPGDPAPVPPDTLAPPPSGGVDAAASWR